MEQHWLDAEQPAPLRPQTPSEHTPPEQVRVPQHSEELAQRVPELWQEPPLQTLLALQSIVPQQSALDEQRWSAPWQETTPSPPPEPLQERARKTGSRRRARRKVRAMPEV